MFAGFYPMFTGFCAPECVFLSALSSSRSTQLSIPGEWSLLTMSPFPGQDFTAVPGAPWHWTFPRITRVLELSPPVAGWDPCRWNPAGSAWDGSVWWNCSKCFNPCSSPQELSWGKLPRTRIALSSTQLFILPTSGSSQHSSTDSGRFHLTPTNNSVKFDLIKVKWRWDLW